jgi:hypothetical protein
MALKYHSTGSTAIFVAKEELKQYFGLVDYSLIFHTNNDNEFTARLIIDMIADFNHAILTVIGHPHTPSDQGVCVLMISMSEVN